MKTLESTGLVAVLLVSFAAAGCGESKPAEQPTPPSPSTVPAPMPSTSASAAPAASADAGATASADAGAAEPAAPKTKFLSFARAANSGKVDKVGAKDGAFKADGVKDLVFDAELEGTASALIVVATDDQGTPTGEFGADTLVGNQKLPSAIAANLNLGKNTAGVVVYEGDKVINGKDGELALGDGKHKLTMYISVKNPPKDAKYAAIAMLADRTLVKSSVAK